jgi:hypothetical protein
MERTVPSTGSEEIALYIRTYYSLLRSSRPVQIKTLIEAHMQSNSALHPEAASADPDLSAFIYALLRLPAPVWHDVALVVLAQSERAFRAHGYPDVEMWQEVSTPARRRRSYYDGADTLAVYIASRSDIDDLVPMLTAYQIEREKLHWRFAPPAVQAWLAASDAPLTSADCDHLAQLTGLAGEDVERLARIWGQSTRLHLQQIGRKRLSLSVRSLAGSLADYKRATRQWWENVERALPQINFADRPVFFVSSNTHSLANLLGGFAQAQEAALVHFVAEEGSADLQRESAEIETGTTRGSRENFLYYILKKYESRYPDTVTARLAAEQQMGIWRIPSRHLFDIEVQLFELNRLDPARFDSRLHLPGLETLRRSEALIINIDFPLGMGAYQVLTEIARNIAGVRGVYVLGKAATLNGRVGDVMIPSVVHDEHSGSTYLFANGISAETVARHLVYGNVLDNQKAITVLGTFLQNERYMSVFYREGYTDMEMEAGPYLSSVYEMIRPKRYPDNEIVHLHPQPFPVGIVHYASDTPMSKGKNLGAQNLSWFGMDATYASSLAVLEAILQEEVRLLAR